MTGIWRYSMKQILILFITSILFFISVSCIEGEKTDTGKTEKMKEIAESFVKLAFHVGKYDKDYVDAYFGPENLKKEAKTENKRLGQIKQMADRQIERLGEISLEKAEELERLRHKYLLRMFLALKARVDFLSGKKMTFDEESNAFYDAVSPSFPTEHYEKILQKLDTLLPGKEPLYQKVNDFKDQFIIPPDRVEAVFNAAIAEARKRTKAHIELMENESFDLEFVKNKSWGAYNWFKGNSKSLIQINTDLPITIDRAVGLACHEGYPGHHVYQSLLEKEFYKKKGWVEFSIYPLFSPLSLISEGTANFGIEVAFPGDERLKFEKEVLFPLAGLDPGKLELYYKVLNLISKLRFAGNDTGRLFIDGEISKEEAGKRLMKYQLRSHERATKYLNFIEQYRAYIINYNLGEQMVKEYIEKRGGTADNPQKRWEEFKKLLSTPVMPGDL